MRKNILVLFLVLICSITLAQSDNIDFIDSPSYIINKENKDSEGKNAQNISAKPSSKPRSLVELSVQAPPEYADDDSFVSGMKNKKKGQKKSQNKAEKRAGKQPRAQPASTNTTQKYSPSVSQVNRNNQSRGTAPSDKRLVYITIEGAMLTNWYARIDNPFDREGAKFTVNPSVWVDFYLGRYVFLGTGLSYNTYGGKLAYPSDYINNLANSGFSAYYEVNRAYAISYIEIPFRFTMKSNSINGWNFLGTLMFNFGIKVRGRYLDVYEDFKYTDGSTEINGELIRKGKLEKKANLWNISGSLRAGAEYAISPNFALTFGLGYRSGFLDALTSKHEKSNDILPDVLSQQFEVYFGFVF